MCTAIFCPPPFSTFSNTHTLSLVPFPVVIFINIGTEINQLWRTQNSLYLSMSATREAPRKPWANGLLSIFSLVIWKTTEGVEGGGGQNHIRRHSPFFLFFLLSQTLQSLSRPICHILSMLYRLNTQRESGSVGREIGRAHV